MSYENYTRDGLITELKQFKQELADLKAEVAYLTGMKNTFRDGLIEKDKELESLKAEKEHWYNAHTTINEKFEQQGKEIDRLKSIVGEEHFTKGE